MKPAVAIAILVIRHVTVIDATGHPPMPDRTVIVRGDRIASIDPSAAARIPAGAQVVEAQGAFLIPGLWDMHVHMRGSKYGSAASFAKENEAALPLYVANGVTGVREMGGDLTAEVLEWRKRAFPRIVTSGPKLDGPKPEWPGSIAIHSPEEGREAVRRVKAMGADFVKIYNEEPNISHEAYVAILDEARRQHMRITGHAPLTMTLAEISDGGQSIEHANEYLAGCVPNEAQLKADLLAGNIPGSEYETALVQGFSRKTAEALFRKFAANGTFVTPTLTVARPPDKISKSDPRRQFLMPRWLESWSDRETVIDEEDLKQAKKEWRESRETIPLLRKAGVTILAGSDTGVSNENLYPGFSLHNELANLVEAGLTPMQALQSATLNAAKWLAMDVGTIEPGKLADLVLLDANPLKDIRNTRKIRAVVMNGQFLDHPAARRP